MARLCVGYPVIGTRLLAGLLPLRLIYMLNSGPKHCLCSDTCIRTDLQGDVIGLLRVARPAQVPSQDNDGNST